MSASLVGSEMCIRDSPRAPLGLGLGLGPGPGRGLGLGAGLGTGFNVGTVSYTHLTLPTICSV
eukprot:1940933-Alexandrium_andersonii.AAC.1